MDIVTAVALFVRMDRIVAVVNAVVVIFEMKDDDGCGGLSSICYMNFCEGCKYTRCKCATCHPASRGNKDLRLVCFEVGKKYVLLKNYHKEALPLIWDAKKGEILQFQGRAVTSLQFQKTIEPFGTILMDRKTAFDTLGIYQEKGIEIK